MTAITSHYTAIVIGAGQAGLSMSYCLKQKNIDHLILEKTDTIASTCRHQRWDSFCLVTPNWQCQLPGFNYPGSEPNGFMVKDDIIAYLESYASSFNPPIRFKSPVTSVKRVNGVFQILTPTHSYTADQVIIACGSYHKPRILKAAAEMKNITHIHSSEYKNPAQIPEGEVMVVGTGQSGCQIAEDLHLAGRKVHLCVGSAPRVNRRYRGKDVVDWLDDMDYYQTTIDQHPEGKGASHATNHYVTGRDGGHDINLRIFAQQGMNLYGRLLSADKGLLRFGDYLYQNLDNADDVAKRSIEKIETYIQENNIEAPADTNIYSDYRPSTSTTLDLEQSNIKTIIWSTGFQMSFDWVQMPVFEKEGFPEQQRGVTRESGLYFLGLNWMHTWGSGRFYHVGRDAEYLTEVIKSSLDTNKEKTVCA
ncbi:MAG: MSMEG_0569 family flavin-dependent oxidoreductase [Pseudomonadales bacterium]|nr:MSMEG_0569 family flavin-dependent oxidoreductase [Pseudomonadales bacterium]